MAERFVKDGPSLRIRFNCLRSNGRRMRLDPDRLMIYDSMTACVILCDDIQNYPDRRMFQKISLSWQFLPLSHSRSDLLRWSAQPLAFCPRWERTVRRCWTQQIYAGWWDVLHLTGLFCKCSWSRLPTTLLAVHWKSSPVGVTEVERKTLQYTLDHMKYTTKVAFFFLSANFGLSKNIASIIWVCDFQAAAFLRLKLDEGKVQKVGRTVGVLLLAMTCNDAFTAF